jgi:hypothetical protein
VYNICGAGTAHEDIKREITSQKSKKDKKYKGQKRLRIKVIVLYVTFNNISVISWRSVLLMEETGVHEEKH